MTDTKELLAQAGVALDAERATAADAYASITKQVVALTAQVLDYTLRLADLQAQLAKLDPWAAIDKTGTADVTDAVQALIDKGEAIPAGRFLIDPERSLTLRDGMDLVMRPDAVLIAKPNGADPTAVLRATGVRNVTITGGQVIGDRDKHVPNPAKQDEHGHGIHIKGCDNVAINGTSFSYCWGDGIDIGPNRVDGKVIPSTNITLDGVECDGNRRNGLTIGNAVGVKVRNSTFSNTGIGDDGTSPFCGIDIEPDAVGEGIARDVLIDKCHVFGNRWGINCRARISSVTVSNSVIEKQVSRGFYALEVDGLTLTGNMIRENGSVGAAMGIGNKGVNVSGNTFAQNAGKAARPFPITGEGLLPYTGTDLTIAAADRVVGVNEYK